MSLHNAAQHLASQGRYGDNMLVHMNPKEVAGLQALAEQKGVSLTRNPQTGMPEAFGLGDLNPFRIVQGKGEIGESGFGSMLIGAALMAAGVPNPMFAAAITGGASLAMGGNLKQAFGQGLGAYGGASMASSAGFKPTQDPNLATVGDLGTAVPPAAPVAAPVAPPVSTTAGMDFGGSSFTGVPPTQAAAQVATATPAPAAAPTAAAPTATPTITKEVAELAAKKGAEPSFMSKYGLPAAGLGALALTQEKPKGVEVAQQSPGMIRPYIYDPDTGGLTQLRPYKAPGYAGGGPVEQMSNASALGMNTGYPQADISGHAYSMPWQTPTSQNVVQGTADTGVNRMTGQMLADGGMAYSGGGISHLGDYSDGGRLLKGPGDGVSDSIPAQIGNKQPARLADGEFVVPARIVSEIGNGSTNAGARKLYAMMDRVQNARKKTTGKNKVAANPRADKYLPA